MTSAKTDTSLSEKQQPPIYLRQQFIACMTIAQKESMRIIRIWKMTVMPPIITIYLFTVVFGQILGSKIGTILGVNYIQFIVPGLIMNIVINESFSNNSSTIVIDKYNKSIESLITAPVHELTLLIGYFMGAIWHHIACGCGHQIARFAIPQSKGGSGVS